MRRRTCAACPRRLYPRTTTCPPARRNKTSLAPRCYPGTCRGSRIRWATTTVRPRDGGRMPGWTRKRSQWMLTFADRWSCSRSFSAVRRRLPTSSTSTTAAHASLPMTSSGTITRRRRPASRICRTTTEHTWKSARRSSTTARRRHCRTTWSTRKRSGSRTGMATRNAEPMHTTVTCSAGLPTTGSTSRRATDARGSRAAPRTSWSCTRTGRIRRRSCCSVMVSRGRSTRC
mmetsp:Transcript_39034/g.112123  ORF Transcript_39034/g.112123 Transcript_39034/m.112123 type:complete len:231 (+) Transcript_39034:245-937(+)